MIRDPKFYLDRATHFNSINKPIYFDDDDDADYEYVKIEPTSRPNLAVVPKPKRTPVDIKAPYKRFYDPITRHYYKSEKIFDIEPVTKPRENPDVWFPENKLSFKTLYDPQTKQYYRVDKVYDKNGTYSYKFDVLEYKPSRAPGTNYYRAGYDLVK